MIRIILLFLLSLCQLLSANCQLNEAIIDQRLGTREKDLYWEIQHPTSNIQHPISITWDLTTEIRLPHGDNIEMSGQQIAGIIYYDIDTNRILTLHRHLIFPQLQVFIEPGQSKWAKYRTYLKHDYEDDILPVIVSGERTIEPGPVDSVVINGMLTFYHAPIQGLVIERTLLPSMTERLFAEGWKITNTTDSSIDVNIGDCRYDLSQEGLYGSYKQAVSSYPTGTIMLKPGESYQFAIFFTTYLNDEPGITDSFEEVLKAREVFLDTIKANLILTTPDQVLNTLFYFSKIRAAESIYQTKMGLVHSPGGGRYYTGIWANDQAEYSGPFFPYLGYETGNIAALNAYRVFAKNIPEGEGNFWSSFEMNGELTCCGGDRGDAAMIAFGASHFALASGDRKIAEELWPLIEWCLDYCNRNKNEDGVITSDSDEMEGRIATGGANLSASSLYYGALLLAIDLGKELDIQRKQIRTYLQQANDLRASIESYFGATLEGLGTYQYFKGHKHLRHWICLPLVMGIDERSEGTLEALFSKLWADNGVRVEYNPDQAEPDLFWDRGTLYAFRGAFKAGGTDRALEKLLSFSQTRLLGSHVPYVVEAWPEGNMAHLSAESALYCRIFTEGLLGINPTGLKSFTINPRLPKEWNDYSLDRIRAFGGDFDIHVSRAGEIIRLKVVQGEEALYDKTIREGEAIRINLK